MSAKDYFELKYNCAESILKDNIKDANIAIATPFGGGIARTNHICGAITGGLLVIGLKEGRTNNSESQDGAQQLAGFLIEEFRDKFNETKCDCLTGCDLQTDEGKIKFEIPERRKKCSEYVEFVDNFIKENVI